MIFEYAKYPDETLVVFSDIREKENGEEYIHVTFERPMEYGFDTIVFELHGKEKIVCACEDFTDNENVLYEFENLVLSANPDKKIY